MNKLFKIYFAHTKIKIYFLVFFVLFYLNYRENLLKVSNLFLYLPIFLTPFYEWVLHKFVLHRIVSTDNKRSFNYSKHLHYNHHTDPNNIFYIFAPFSAYLILMLQVYFLFSLIGLSFKAGLSSACAASLVFLIYEWFHLAHHVAEYAPITTFGKNLKKNHLLHHFHNENYWWGITSNFADRLLGSIQSSNQIKKSPFAKNIAHLSPIPTQSDVKNDELLHSQLFYN